MEEMDPAIAEMVESGALHETQVPFNESSNTFAEEDNTQVVQLPHTIELSVPFNFGSTEYKKLTFENRLTTKMTMHLPLMGKTRRGHYVPIVASMTGESESLIKELSPADFMECIGVVLGFF